MMVGVVRCEISLKICVRLALLPAAVALYVMATLVVENSPEGQKTEFEKSQYTI